MLTGDLAISWQRGNRIVPRALDVNDADYLRAADELIAIVRAHQGARRVQLEQALEDYIGLGTDYRILRGLIKLLMDRCRFAIASPVEPFELRQKLFLHARTQHPINEANREEVLTAVAQELNCPTQVITTSLFADLPDNQALLEFDELSADELLATYNLAQAQALLYRCVEMTVWVEPQDAAGYRQLFDAIKYYRLIHEIKGRAAIGYEIHLSGPVSLFHRSQKYGVQMAVFLPALLECRAWRMRAEIEAKNNKRVFFELNSDQQQLRASDESFAPMNNELLEKLLTRWPDLGSAWTLERCQEVIDLGEGAFIPDLVARKNEQKIYCELLGFWTPRFLKQRLDDFAYNRMTNFLLAISEELRGSREAPATLPPNVLTYKTTLNARDLLAAIERLSHTLT
jgi:uncharacterized protein